MLPTEQKRAINSTEDGRYNVTIREIRRGILTSDLKKFCCKIARGGHKGRWNSVLMDNFDAMGQLKIFLYSVWVYILNGLKGVYKNQRGL